MVAATRLIYFASVITDVPEGFFIVTGTYSGVKFISMLVVQSSCSFYFRRSVELWIYFLEVEDN